MDEVEGKGADYNGIATEDSSIVVYSSNEVSLSGNHQIRHLNDVAAAFKADGLCDVPIRKEQVCKVIVRKGFDMVGGDAGADGGSLRRSSSITLKSPRSSLFVTARMAFRRTGNFSPSCRKCPLKRSGCRLPVIRNPLGSP